VSTSARPIDELERTIAERAAKPSEKSYTTKLLAGGVEAIGAQNCRRVDEVVEAAGEPGEAGREHFVREVGDLVYHLMSSCASEIAHWPTWRLNFIDVLGSLVWKKKRQGRNRVQSLGFSHEPNSLNPKPLKP